MLPAAAPSRSCVFIRWIPVARTFPVAPALPLTQPWCLKPCCQSWSAPGTAMQARTCSGRPPAAVCCLPVDRRIRCLQQAHTLTLARCVFLSVARRAQQQCRAVELGVGRLKGERHLHWAGAGAVDAASHRAAHPVRSRCECSSAVQCSAVQCVPTECKQEHSNWPALGRLDCWLPGLL